MNKITASLAVLGSLSLVTLATAAQASVDCHCYYHPPAKHIIYYKPVTYHFTRYVPVYGYKPKHHCFCYVVHHPHNPYAPYPNVFIEDAHVYVPPMYYYSPYSFVSAVLVHRSIEIGPTPSATDSSAVLP